VSDRISGSQAAVLQGCSEATCRQAEPVLPPQRSRHVSKRNGKREMGRRRCGLEVTPRAAQHVPRVPGDAPATEPQRLSAIIHSSALHYALLSSLFSWLKPQVKNKTMLLLKICFFKTLLFFFYSLSFGRRLQLMEHCWGGGTAATLSAGSLPARIRP